MAHMLCSVIPPGRTKPIFILTPSTESVSHMTLSNEEAGSSSQSRTDAVMEVMSFLRTQGVIQGWRDELYPLSDGYYNEPLLLVERAAAPFLGTQQVSLLAVPGNLRLVDSIHSRYNFIDISHSTVFI
jgi:hypothetical protein